MCYLPGMQIIDSHTHAFPDAIAAGAIKTLSDSGRWEKATAFTDGTVKGLLNSMDRAGVHASIVCSIATRPSQVQKITDWSVSIASERIIPFASIHPDYEKPEAECERIASLGLRGIKFHPQYQMCAIDDPRTHRIAKAAAANDLAFTVHGGYDLAFDHSDAASPASIRRLFDAVPRLRLQACHMGGWRRWEESLELLAGLPVYLETSYSLGSCPQELLDRMIEKHPPEYFMWGTDSPWKDQASELALFRTLRLDDRRATLALETNARTLVGARRSSE